MITITKEQFNSAYDKHLPSKWIKFAFKYFSSETIDKNFSIKYSLVYVMLAIFLIGFLGTVLDSPKVIIGISTLIYSIILVTLILYLFSAIILNNIRIRKIRKELSVNRYVYDALVSLYKD